MVVKLFNPLVTGVAPPPAGKKQQDEPLTQLLRALSIWAQSLSTSNRILLCTYLCMTRHWRRPRPSVCKEN
ncbi:unnamed protein product [Amoebophrya sp. A25]|nr:unnamed protein product [Amoebophrya sp. A25]|eukprot:GSA25T00008327001.1